MSWYAIVGFCCLALDCWVSIAYFRLVLELFLTENSDAYGYVGSKPVGCLEQ
jgi:hypothetical protein